MSAWTADRMSPVWKIAVPAMSMSAPAATRRAAFPAVTPPSRAIAKERPASARRLAARASLSNAPEWRLLSGEARLNGHDHEQVDFGQPGANGVQVLGWVNRQADRRAGGADAAKGRCGLGQGVELYDDRCRTPARHRLEDLVGALHLEVEIDRQGGVPAECGDMVGRQGQVGHVVPIHDIDVEAVDAGGLSPRRLRSQRSRIGGEKRGAYARWLHRGSRGSVLIAHCPRQAPPMPVVERRCR